MKREALPEADAIVLLGGFSAPSREEVGRLHFNQSADRAVTALELLRLGKAKTLVVGGSAVTVQGEPFVEADLFKGILKSWQGTGPEVISLGGCKHTRHEAEKVARVAQEQGWKRVLLVTSASHLRRATGCFCTTTGLEVVPVPSAFLTSVSIITPDSLDLRPARLASGNSRRGCTRWSGGGCIAGAVGFRMRPPPDEDQAIPAWCPPLKSIMLRP